LSETRFKHDPWLALAGIAASLCLSLWAISIDSVINNDGVHYILTAEFIAAGQWGEALNAFKWPAYSLLIYLVQLLPMVDYEAAARIVTTLGFTLVVLGFVSVCRLLGARGRVAWLSLLVILVYPGINEFRSFLIRDSIFLALYLFALLNLLKYARGDGMGPLFWSFLLFSLAALFRVEAAIFVFVFPAILISRRAPRAWRLPLFGLYGLIALEVLGTFYGWWLFRPEDQLDPWTLLEQSQDLFSQGLGQLASELNQHVAGVRQRLPGWTPGFLAWPVTLLMVAWIVFSESVEALTLPFALLLLVALVRGRPLLELSRPLRRALWIVCLVHLAVLLAFAGVRFFLTPRYPIALTLTLALFVPFAINRLVFEPLRPVSGLARYFVAGFVALLILVNAVEGLDSFSRKSHIREAGLWLRQNVPADARLISNDIKFLYYADRHRDTWVLVDKRGEFEDFLYQGTWRWKDWVAVYLRRGDESLANQLKRTLAQRPVQSFSGPRGDKMLIFHTADD